MYCGLDSALKILSWTQSSAGDSWVLGPPGGSAMEPLITQGIIVEGSKSWFYHHGPLAGLR